MEILIRRKGKESQGGRHEAVAGSGGCVAETGAQSRRDRLYKIQSLFPED